MEEEKARRRAEKQPGFDGRWYTDVNAHTRFVTLHHVILSPYTVHVSVSPIVLMMMR